MKIKSVLILGTLTTFLFGILFFVVILFADEDDSDNYKDSLQYMNLSSEVLAYKPMVEKYCKEFGIEEYVNYILAIMQVESGGKGKDVLQSSESLGLPPNSLNAEESIKQGCKYFSELLDSSNKRGMDIDAVVQSYNMGGGYLNYIELRGSKYSYQLTEGFACEKSNGKKVEYRNDISIPINGGWRYNYGNQFYVLLVSQYLLPIKFDDATVQKIMNEAIKYEGFPYVFGGANPNTSFDCSGLVMWCYAKVGINLPRVAQSQYDVTQHITLSEAKAGDLIFFHSTYDAGTYVTHVGIYVGNNQMYHAGSPIGYESLNNKYWQDHLIGAGRIIQR